MLDNKEFKFFKQLMYNIALAICIMLLGVLAMTYVFKYELYEVLSDSQYPVFKSGDLVVVKAQKEYKIGDIINFQTERNVGVTHRLVGVVEEGSTTYYLCHGDNVQSAVRPSEYERFYRIVITENNEEFSKYRSVLGNCKPKYVDQVGDHNEIDWEIDRAYIEFLQDEGLTYQQIVKGKEVGDEVEKGGVQNVQSVTKNQIKGKVVNHVDNYGTYFKFVKKHYLFLICIIAGIWCVCTVVQDEIEMKRARRLL